MKTNKNQTHAKLSWVIDSDEENQCIYREGELLKKLWCCIGGGSKR